MAPLLRCERINGPESGALRLSRAVRICDIDSIYNGTVSSLGRCGCKSGGECCMCCSASRVQQRGGLKIACLMDKRVQGCLLQSLLSQILRPVATLSLLASPERVPTSPVRIPKHSEFSEHSGQRYPMLTCPAGLIEYGSSHPCMMMLLRRQHLLTVIHRRQGTTCKVRRAYTPLIIV